jgi:hypothetical protein
MSSDCSEIREHMCNFTISFIKNNLVGGQSWMVSLSIPLVLRRFLGWKELLRSEVVEVVRTLDGDKALSLDGFSMAFFETCWEVIKDDIMDVFKEFHLREKFGKSFNATFISLIPKKAMTVDIKDFCLISLVSGAYKIILGDKF